LKNLSTIIPVNGVTENGFISILLEKEQTTFVFKNVPAQICSNCGEEYVSSEVNRAILNRALHEHGKGVTLEMLRFAA
jgi:YgiT-type zinc finger domain-containing protein